MRIDSFLVRHLRNYTPYRMQRMVRAGQVRIDGTVDGSVMVVGGSVTLGPCARIGGGVTTVVGRAVIPASAVVGGVEATLVGAVAADEDRDYYLVGVNLPDQQ